MDRNKGDGFNRGKPERQIAPSRGRRGEIVESGHPGEKRHSRAPLARMARLHEWLMANRFPNCRKLADEFEVSAKTVQRDVNFMRDQLGLPIEYDKERFGFQYTRPVTEFPGLGIYASRPVGKLRAGPWRQSALPAFGEHPILTSSDSGGTIARIRFDAESARAARARTWHPTQVIRSLPDGGLEMTLRAREECEVARWVLSWAGHAWVIHPQHLRNRLREAALEILARHH
ncbi:MAG: WYL domain-containing protein [Chthoniobacteraceae bacterium]